MKLTIDWSKVPSEFKWAAMDADGEVWAFSCKPVKTSACFDLSPTLGIAQYIDTEPYSDNWRGSLTERPTEEPKVKQPAQATAKPHKHAALISEWIKDTSRVVEFRVGKNDHWKKTGATPAWGEHAEYRFADTVKPEFTSPLETHELEKVCGGELSGIDLQRAIAIAIAAKIATLKEVAAMPSQTTLTVQELDALAFSPLPYHGVANVAIAEFQKRLLKQLGE